MKERFINQTIYYIERKKTISELERKRLKYGLEGFYNLATKTVVIIGITSIFGLIKELFLLIFIYSTFRLYGFGIHAKKSWQCWITTVPVYVGGCFFIRYATISQPIIIYGIWILGFCSLLFFAPADTASRPLIHKEKRIRAKVLSLLICLGYFLLNHFYPSTLLLNTTLYALLFESVVINPLTYKLFNMSFNNYKTYGENTV